MSEAELRQLFGAALEPVSVQPLRSLHERILEGGPPRPEARAEPQERAEPRPEAGEKPQEPFAGQVRLARAIPTGDVRRAEYDLFRGRVYRVRWLLSERFERPLMAPLVAHLRERLGEPVYDQTLPAKLGSERSELRRTGWRRGAHSLEVRQLHPLTGGPLYLTLSDVAAMQAIVEARAVVLPQPETTGEWWRRPQQRPALLSPAERERLLAAIDSLLERIGFPASDS